MISTGMRFTATALPTLVFFYASAVSGQAIFFPLEASDSSAFRIISEEDRDFSDGNSDTDVNVTFGFNYATGGVGDPAVISGAPFPAGIPEAPNTRVGDAPRTGLFLSADDDLFVNSQGISQVTAIATDPNDSSQLLSVTGNYEVQVDVWMNYRLASGNATEYGGLLVGHDGARPGILAGAGFAYAGDSGAVSDHRLYKSAPASAGIADLEDNDEDAGFGLQDQFVTVDGGGALTGSDGQYNPDIGLTYLDDPQFDPQARAALDAENDFWQDAFTARFDLGAALDPYVSQGADQDGPSPAFNAPGDLGFRWATIRMEVEPSTMGNGTRNEPGIARVYLTGTWQDDGDNNLATFDPVTTTSPELFIGTLDNSIDDPDVAGFTPDVIDFSQGIAMTYFDGFPSFDDSGFVFGVFDNLIITPESTGNLIGDADGDGDVDGDDLIAVQTNFGNVAPPNPLLGDADFDGDVDGDDLIAVQTNFGATAAAAIPEPASSALALLLAATAIARRERPTR